MTQILPHVNISEQGLRELELWLEKRADKIEWGPWIYVGTFPTDPDTTVHSPPFQNGVVNKGGGLRRLRFRAVTPRTFRKTNSLQFSGSVVAPADGTVVTNVAAIYRPSETEWGTGANDDGSIDIWRLDTNGDLVYVTKMTGGSSSSIEREQIAGDGDAPVTIGSSSSGLLDWTTHLSGSSLLDLSDPFNPVVVTSGVYAVSVQALPIALTAGASFAATLILDSAGESPQVQQDSPPGDAFDTTPKVALSLTYYLPAGAVLNLYVFNRDSISQDFTMPLAVVQRLS